MRRVRNILVYPCETQVGMELNRSLRFSPHFRVFGCAGDSVRAGYAFADSAGFLPPVGSDEFLPELTRVIRERSIDFVYPASDEALAELAELAADGLVEAEVVAPSLDVCRICASKTATHAFFSGKLELPKQYRRDSIDASEYPVWAISETRWSNGRRVDGRAELFGDDESVFEYMPGAEFAVDCFSDAGRALLFVAGRERRVFERGVGVNDVLCDREEFRRFAEAINVELKMRGAWCFLLREDAERNLRLIGIRAGLGLGSGLQRIRGVNLAAATLCDRLGMDVSFAPNGMDGASVDRRYAEHCRLNVRYDTVYLDLENTVVVDGKVDLDAIRFIFACRNRGTRVVAVERGFDPPEKMLAAHGLAGLFDQVLWIEGNEGKSSVMTSSKAIFVDDNSTERREVALSLGIPVFDPSAFDALTEA